MDGETIDYISNFLINEIDPINQLTLIGTLEATDKLQNLVFNKNVCQSIDNTDDYVFQLLNSNKSTKLKYLKYKLKYFNK
jgi:cAMP phosphodiesterase